ncbi:MAG: hypothetical protein KAX13_12680, partial [Candidatus Krumholzibacteria bacterium]|nr:hypothetical protein [Candidatus Krumholzibacteria bacterium]
IAVASTAISAIALWMWGSVFSRPATGEFIDGVWIFMGCLAVAAAFTMWSHAVVLIGHQRGPALRRLPDWIKHPWVAGPLGLLLPGLGLFITGHARRAAFALWVLGAALISTLVLSHAGWIWSWNKASGAVAFAPHTLEYLFLTLGVVVLFGVLTWIVQALDGARLAGPRSMRQARMRGDVIAVALLAAILVFAVSFEPGLISKTLDDFAVTAYGEGFKVIPVHAVRSAVALDPSKPVYVLHAASIYEDLGKSGEARALRLELWDRWEPCVGLFEDEGRLVRSETPLRPEDTSAEQDVLDEFVSDHVVIVEPIGTGRLATWDHLDALYGIFAIEEFSPSGADVE